MIRCVRTAVVPEFKMAAFLPLFRKMVEYVNTRWPDTNAQGLRQRFDVPNVTCYFVADFADLAELDRWLSETGSDEGYGKILDEMRDALIPDAGCMVLLESV